MPRRSPDVAFDKLPPTVRPAALVILVGCAALWSPAVNAGTLVETRGFTRGVPRKPTPSPDGARVYFLRSGPKDRLQQLYVYDVHRGDTGRFVSSDRLAGSGDISAREQARRERQRETERGVTHYTLSRDGERILVPYSGDVFLVDTDDGDVHRVTQTDEVEVDPSLSPDGTRVAFLRGPDVFVMPAQGGRATQLTHASTAGIRYGAAEFVAQEEMDRDHGYWWSPDSKWIALMEVDASDVPTFEVPNLTDAEGRGAPGPYPKTGDTNARVRLGVVSVDGGAVRWLDLGDGFEYIARVAWAPDSQSLWVQTQPRRQRQLDVRRVPLDGAPSRVVLREQDRHWINLHHNFHLLDDGKSFVWSSERSGLRNLELVGDDGTRERVLTPDDFNVNKLAHVDEKRGLVYFTAWTREEPRELHFYRVRLRGGGLRRLSDEPGWHDVAFHERGDDVYVETFSDEHTPPHARVRGRSGDALGELPSTAEVIPAAELEPRPQFMRFETAAGVSLDLRVLRPEGEAAARSLPLVVYVYGGPHGQQVRRRWGGEREQIDRWLARHGYVVARIDGRGAWGRGHASETIYSERMGEHELRDQVDGVFALIDAMPEIDPERVGIWGASYGGYMTLMALMRTGDVFRVGTSIAPVVDWNGYDTHYTERYLGQPKDNPEGYEASSVLTYAPQLEGHLTLVHGSSDDNVHMRESMLLVKSLVELGTQFDLMVYPGTHMIQSVVERTHLYELLWRTFAEHLSPRQARDETNAIR
jgi:dipeptidyl-peptidase-4